MSDVTVKLETVKTFETLLNISVTVIVQSEYVPSAKVSKAITLNPVSTVVVELEQLPP